MKNKKYWFCYVRGIKDAPRILGPKISIYDNILYRRGEDPSYIENPVYVDMDDDPNRWYRQYYIEKKYDTLEEALQNHIHEFI